MSSSFRGSYTSSERQALRNSGAALDPDTIDYYDGADGLPAPHRLTSRYSTSAYPEMAQPQTTSQIRESYHATASPYDHAYFSTSNSASPQKQLPLAPNSRPTSAAYSDPFANSYAPSAGVGHRHSESYHNMNPQQGNNHRMSQQAPFGGECDEKGSVFFCRSSYCSSCSHPALPSPTHLSAFAAPIERASPK